MITPAGTANFSTRRKNPGRNRWVFGSRARKKAGMPIVRAVTTVRWRFRNGKGSTRTTVAIDTTIA